MASDELEILNPAVLRFANRDVDGMNRGYGFALGSMMGTLMALGLGALILLNTPHPDLTFFDLLWGDLMLGGGLSPSLFGPTALPARPSPTRSSWPANYAASTCGRARRRVGRVGLTTNSCLSPR
jgi:hypothetical protein